MKFLIEMDEVCELSYLNICQGCMRECSGELDDRPDWCPLVLVEPPKEWV